MIEEWRDIPGYPGYQASSHGRVRSPNKILTQVQRKKQKYLVVGIGHGNAILVHQLVALAFHGIPNSDQEVCHNNGNRTDNRHINLRWDTRKANVADTFSHGRGNVGSKNGQAKLTEQQAEIIKRDKRSQYEIAADFGISQSSVSRIRTGATWSCR